MRAFIRRRKKALAVAALAILGLQDACKPVDTSLVAKKNENLQLDKREEEYLKLLDVGSCLIEIVPIFRDPGESAKSVSGCIPSNVLRWRGRLDAQIVASQNIAIIFDNSYSLTKTDQKKERFIALERFLTLISDRVKNAKVKIILFNYCTLGSEVADLSGGAGEISRVMRAIRREPGGMTNYVQALREAKAFLGPGGNIVMFTDGMPYVVGNHVADQCNLDTMSLNDSAGFLYSNPIFSACFAFPQDSCAQPGKAGVATSKLASEVVKMDGDEKDGHTNPYNFAIGMALHLQEFRAAKDQGFKIRSVFLNGGCEEGSLAESRGRKTASAFKTICDKRGEFLQDLSVEGGVYEVTDPEQLAEKFADVTRDLEFSSVDFRVSYRGGGKGGDTGSGGTFRGGLSEQDNEPGNNNFLSDPFTFASTDATIQINSQSSNPDGGARGFTIDSQLVEQKSCSDYAAFPGSKELIQRRDEGRTQITCRMRRPVCFYNGKEYEVGQRLTGGGKGGDRPFYRSRGISSVRGAKGDLGGSTDDCVPVVPECVLDASGTARWSENLDTLDRECTEAPPVHPCSLPDARCGSIEQPPPPLPAPPPGDCYDGRGRFPEGAEREFVFSGHENFASPDGRVCQRCRPKRGVERCQGGEWFKETFGIPQCPYDDNRTDCPPVVPTCDGQAVGTRQERTIYSTQPVCAGEACVRGLAWRDCTTRGWTPWVAHVPEGGGSDALCPQIACQGTPRPCDGIGHGGTGVTCYIRGANGVCIPTQQRCQDGTLYPPIFECEQTCQTPPGQTCLDPATGQTLQNGAVQQRQAWENRTGCGEDICRSEVQQRVCVNGSLGPWTGSPNFTRTTACQCNGTAPENDRSEVEGEILSR